MSLRVGLIDDTLEKKKPQLTWLTVANLSKQQREHLYRVPLIQ